MANHKPAGTQNELSLIAVVGKSGSGKGVYIKRELLSEAKIRGRVVIVFSPLEQTDNYAKIIKGQVVRSMGEFVKAIESGKTRIVYHPNETDDIKKQFDKFCRAVWSIGNCVLLVEELSRVTMASWAPIAWKNICTAGRHQGIEIIGVCQRPAQVDKEFLGNATEIRCYKVGFMADAKAMADVLFMKPDDVLALTTINTPTQFKSQYIHRYVNESRNEIGTIEFKK
jgi:hypothetical protein